MEQKKTSKSVFETLNALNVNEHIEQKNGLSYLSWAWAWQVVKQNFPEAFYTIYENKDGLFYHTDGKTAWVKTGVTIEGQEHIEFLPVMDNRNRSISLDNLTSTDVNKAIQRSLTKACARHGLGLYIYAGEDLPDEEARRVQEDTIANIAQAVQEMNEVKSREEFVACWKKWNGILPASAKQTGGDFMSAAQAVGTKYPKAS